MARLTMAAWCLACRSSADGLCAGSLRPCVPVDGVTMADLPDWERELLEHQAAEQRAAGLQRLARRVRLGPMPAMFEPLATYNAERARGIVHTPEWDDAMVALQLRFNEWAGL